MGGAGPGCRLQPGSWGPSVLCGPATCAEAARGWARGAAPPPARTPRLTRVSPARPCPARAPLSPRSTTVCACGSDNVAQLPLSLSFLLCFLWVTCKLYTHRGRLLSGGT